MQSRTSTNNSTMAKVKKKAKKSKKKMVKKRKMKMETRFQRRRPRSLEADLDNLRVVSLQPTKDSKLLRRLEMELKKLEIWERKSEECSETKYDWGDQGYSHDDV